MTTKTIRSASRIIRRAGPVEFRFSAEDVRAASRRLAEPSWLADRRMAAWETWESLPLPTVQDEPWRRTDLRGLPADRVGLKPSEGSPVPVSSDGTGPNLLV